MLTPRTLLGLSLGLAGCQSLWGGFYEDPPAQVDMSRAPLDLASRCKTLTFAATTISVPELGAAAVVAGRLTPQSAQGGPPDLAIAGQQAGDPHQAIMLLRNDGTGSFAKDPLTQLSDAFNNGGRAHLALGNITSRSGVADVVAQFDLSNNPLVLLSPLDVGKWSQKVFGVSAAPQRNVNVAVADLNPEDGLGLADVVTAVNVSGFAVGYAAGGQSVSAKDYPISPIGTPWGMAVGQLDKDAAGLNDVVLVDPMQAPDDPRLIIRFNTGDSANRFNTTQQRIVALTGMPATRFFVLVLAADLNGDGLADLAVANDTSGMGSGLVSVLLNDPGNPGTFPTQRWRLPVGREPVALASGDLDGDGRAELITANHQGNSLSLLRNRGDGSFLDAVDFPGLPSQAAPTSVAIADLNRDGKLDVVSANSATNSVTVFLNTCQ